MLGGKVRQLVGDHATHLLGREPFEEGQPQQQVVPVPAEHTEPGDLRDGSVHLVRDQHGVHRPRAQLAPHLLDHLE
jgi:hypothetical protein